MKKLLTTVLVLLSLIGYTQSPFVMQNLNPETPVSANQVSMGNLYSAWKVSSTFTEKGDLNFPKINASLLWNLPQIGKVILPVVGTVGFPLKDSATSINMGLRPYAVVKTTPNMSIIVHGAIEYSNLVKTEEDYFKVLAGLEIAVFTSNGLPFTISVTPAYSSITVLESNWLIETTGIFPLAKNLAGIVETDILFKAKPVFRLGILVSKLTN